MNDAQRTRLATLRDHYRPRGMDVHGFDGDDDLLHVVVYGRITGAEIEAHTIAPDGSMDDEPRPDAASSTPSQPAGEQH